MHLMYSIFSSVLLVIISNPLRHSSKKTVIESGREHTVALVNTCLELWPFR